MLISPKKIMLPGKDYELKLPKPHLSFSQISLYTQCPAKYRAQYVLGKKEKPGKGMRVGTALHKVTERFLTEKLSFPDAVQCYIDTYEGELTQLELDDVTELLRRVLPVYREKFFDVSSVEQEFETIIAGVPVVGRIDLRQEGVVWDSKFLNPKGLDAYRRPRNLQLMLYTHVAKVGCAGFILVNKQTGSVELVAQPAPTHVEQVLENVVSRVAYGISVGSFPLTSPDVFQYCGPCCSQWKKCYGK